MNSLLSQLLPELILIGTACVLLLLGISSRVTARLVAPWLAVAALVACFVIQLPRSSADSAAGAPVLKETTEQTAGAPTQIGDRSVLASSFSEYIKLITAGVGVILILLAWPTNKDATGNPALSPGPDSSEFLALMLLSISGVMLVAGANDLMLLFLGIELASIPTYIMVALSRPQAVAQEAGVKYFFLGAMAAAVMLMGFAYLYGTTGSTNLQEIYSSLHKDKISTLNGWQLLAIVLIIAGFAFKIAAVPLHFYAGDVYQGAATSVTAFLSFVPKTSGFVALIKILSVVGGPRWDLPEPIVKANGTGMLFVLAILTMTVGNVLGLLQYNIKRVLAYSSIAHTGYMLTALAAMGASQVDERGNALQGLLFYLAAYGMMNAGVFGVLALLPSRDGKGSAETFDDLAGQGRKHVGLGLAMAVCCFSLIGIPLTIGFIGKLMLIKPALLAASMTPVGGVNPVRGAMIWLVIITVVNAAISAGYYLRIVGAMFLRTEKELEPQAQVFDAPPGLERGALPIVVAIALSVGATLFFGGVIPPAAEMLGTRAGTATVVHTPIVSSK